MMETSTKYMLHYDVLSPNHSRWHRCAGPFASVEDAQTDLANKSGVVAYRIVRETVTTEVVVEIGAR